MTKLIQGSDAIRLLEAHGFSRDSNRNSLMKVAHFKTDDRSDEVVIEVQDALERSMPREETTHYRTVFSQVSTEAKLKDVVFSSLNAADILAFAIGAINDVRMEYGEQIDDAYVFFDDDDDGVGIHNPFADDEYGNWILDAVPGDGEIQVAHPAEYYGEPYCRWRDALAEATLKGKSPTP